MDTPTAFNTNIEEYTMDELFNLLSIKIDNNSNYEDGMPHTRNDVIILPKKIQKISATKIREEMRKEGKL